MPPWGNKRTTRSPTDVVSATRVTVLVVALLTVAIGAATVAATQGGAVAPDDCDPDDDVRGDHLLEGCLDASADEQGWAKNTTYAVPDRADTLVITMAGPSDADFDLYVTLDGRTPTADDYDRRSKGQGSEERIVVDVSGLSDDARIGVLARAYEGSGDVRVDVQPIAEPEATFTAPETARPDERITFDASGSTVPIGPGAYVWTVDGTEVHRGIDPTLTHEFTEPGSHEVTLTVVGLERNDSITRQVTVEGPRMPDVVARIGVLADERVWVNQSVRFTAARTAVDEGPVAAYEWRFGDGTTASGETVSHAFREPGTYNVSLVVRTASGSESRASTTVEVDQPEVWIRDVDGAEIAPLDHFFHECPDPIWVQTEGSEPIERVRFAMGNATAVDRNGSDGWMIDKKNFLDGRRAFASYRGLRAVAPANESGVLRVTAVTADGTTATKSVQFQVSTTEPKILKMLADFAGSNMGSPNFKKWTPVQYEDCQLTIRYPQVSKDVSSIPGTGGTFGLASKLTDVIPLQEEINLAGKFTMKHMPLERQVMVGGGGLIHVPLNPVGETRANGQFMVSGVFDVNERGGWSPHRFRINGSVRTRVYVEEYFGITNALSIEDFPWAIPGIIGSEIKQVDFELDPLDVYVDPRIDVRGSINDDLEWSSLRIEGSGRISVVGQLGDECHFNFGTGCFALRAWVEGSLASDYMGFVPFDPELKGTAAVVTGVQITSPTNFHPDFAKTKRWEWDLPASSPVLRSGAATTPDARAYAGTDADPVLTVETDLDTGFGPKRTGSPGAAFRDREGGSTAAAHADGLLSPA